MEKERTKPKHFKFDTTDLGPRSPASPNSSKDFFKGHGYEVLLVVFGIAGLLSAAAITTGLVSLEISNETDKAIGTVNLRQPLQQLNVLLTINPLLHSARLDRARILTKLHKYPEALADYNFLLNEDPNNIEGLERRAALAIVMNKYDVTLADCNKVIELQKEKSSEYTYANRAIAYSMLGKKQEAIDDYSSALRNKSTDPGLYIGRANVYRDMHKYDEAFEDYEWVKMLKPNSGAASLGKAQCYVLQKNFPKALQSLNEAIAIDKADARNYVERGKLFWAMSKVDDAAKDFEKAQMLDPENTEALTEQLRVHTFKQDNVRALQDVNRLVMAGSQSYDIFMKRADLEFDQKKYQLAALGYARAAELQPNEIAPLVGRAKVMAANKSYRTALEMIDAAIKVKPGDPQLFALRGHYNMLSNNGMSAEKDFDKAIALSSDNLNAYLWRGEGLYDQKQYVSAEQDLEKVLRLDPKNVDAKFYLGLTRAAISRSPRAVVASSSSSSSSSSTAVDAKTAALLAGGDASALATAGMNQYRNGRYDSAIKLLAKAVQLNPSAASVRRVLAASLLAANYNSEAATQYQGVISQEPGNSADMQAMCRALAASHRNEDLITAATKYLESNPKDNKVKLLLIQGYQASGFTKKAEELCAEAIHSSSNVSELSQFEGALRSLNPGSASVKKPAAPATNKPLPDTQG